MIKKIAIASGKGGTGKTFLSTNLFKVMKQSGLRVALVDCDAEVPNDSLFLPGCCQQEWKTRLFCPAIQVDQCTYCNQCATNCKFHAITCISSARYIKVMEDLCHGCGACLYDCPSQAIRSSYKVIGKVTAIGHEGQVYLIEGRVNEGEHSAVPVIREAIRRAEDLDVDYLLLDAPPGCSCPFVNTVLDADRVILVTEPTPFGLSDLKHTVDVLRKLSKPFGVIINRCDMGDGRMYNYLREEHIELLAEIPYSEHIASMYAQGELAVLQDESVAAMFTNIMQKLTTK